MKPRNFMDYDYHERELERTFSVIVSDVIDIALRDVEVKPVRSELHVLLPLMPLVCMEVDMIECYLW